MYKVVSVVVLNPGDVVVVTEAGVVLQGRCALVVVGAVGAQLNSDEFDVVVAYTLMLRRRRPSNKLPD
jgi:hypothetical protein